jgi:hypothetical protein
MRQRCEYCDSWIDDTDEVCPHCGAPNAHMMVSGEGVPKTISELKEFCERHNLPLKDMRFFIGENRIMARAFGIYQDGEDFVVYKNKSDGTRVVRYRGHDEAYAVNELYQKMKSEVTNQRLRRGTKEVADAERKELRFSIMVLAGIVCIVGSCVIWLFSLPYSGYYDFEDTTYFHNDGGWYYFDTTASDWVLDSDPPAALTENSHDYYTSYDWDESMDATDFSSSSNQANPSGGGSDDSYDSGGSTGWDDDWDDDDWDWDSSDSWDSSLTDWDSDW